MVSWEPEGRYHYWEPERRFRHWDSRGGGGGRSLADWSGTHAREHLKIGP